MTAPRGFAAGLTAFLSQMIAQNGAPWYDRFLSAIVVPHAGVFTIVVIVGESLVAASMLSGIGTRASAIGAIVLLLNYAAAKGLPLWSPASNDAADIVLAFVVLAGQRPLPRRAHAAKGAPMTQ